MYLWKTLTGPLSHHVPAIIARRTRGFINRAPERCMPFESDFPSAARQPMTRRSRRAWQMSFLAIVHRIFAGRGLMALRDFLHIEQGKWYSFLALLFLFYEEVQFDRKKMLIYIVREEIFIDVNGILLI